MIRIALALLLVAIFAPSSTVAQLQFAVGGESIDQFHDMSLMPGGLVTTGVFAGTVEFSPLGTSTVQTGLLAPGSGFPLSTNFLTVYDGSAGTWFAHTLGGGLSDDPLSGGNAVAAAPDGGFVFAGFGWGTVALDPSVGSASLASAASSPTSGDALLVRYDATGSAVFGHFLGGSSLDRAYAVAVDQAGNTYVGGSFQGEVDFDPGTGQAVLTAPSAFPGLSTDDGWVARFDAAGELDWVLGIGGPLTDRVHDITIDSFGNPIVVGFLSSDADVTLRPSGDAAAQVTPLNGWSGPPFDGFVLGLNPDGTTRFAMVLAGTSLDRAMAVSPAPNGSIDVGGSFSGSLDFDGAGPEPAVVASGDSDGYVARFDAAGAFVSVSTFGGTDALSEVRDLVPSPDGGVSVAGHFSGIVDFDPGVGINSLTSSSGAADSLDGFALALTAVGSLDTVHHLEGDAMVRATAVEATGDGLVVAGTFASSLSLDGGSNLINMSPAYQWDGFVVSTSSSTGVSTDTPPATATIDAYPNPVQAGGEARLSSDGEGVLSVYDTLGRKVFERTLRGGGYVSWRTDRSAPGMYFAVIESRGRRSTRPVVVVR